MLLLGAGPLSGCGASNWSNLKVKATALVDGHQVVASTIWRGRLIPTFLGDGGGVRSELHGLALAIPVDKNEYVYGIFRQTWRGETLLGGPELLDAYNLDLHKRDTVDPPPFSTPAKFRDYAVRKLAGQNVAVCLPLGDAVAPRDGCPVFVYFERPDQPETVRQMVPRQAAIIAGHQVVITSVTMSYVPDGAPQSTRLDMLPAWLRGADRLRFGNPLTNSGWAPYGVRDFIE